MSPTRIVALLSLGFSLGVTSLSAVSFPPTWPSGSFAWWSFGTYFQNLVNNPCPSGEAITGFSTGTLTYGEPICETISGGGGGGSSASWWLLSGNTGTTAGTDFIGTNDDVDLVFKRNNIRVGYFGTDGNLGIGPNTLISNTNW
jgi:hypothetical protein